MKESSFVPISNTDFQMTNKMIILELWENLMKILLEIYLKSLMILLRNTESYSMIIAAKLPQMNILNIRMSKNKNKKSRKKKKSLKLILNKRKLLF